MSQRFERNERLKRGHRSLRVVYADVDEVMAGAATAAVEAGAPLSCTKGCHACCSILPMSTLSEAIYALACFIATRNDKPDSVYDAARKQIDYLMHRDASAEEWFERKTRCVFLSDEGTCNVYDARPLNCRIYAVKTPPEACSGKAKDLVGALDTRELRQAVWARFKEVHDAFDVDTLYGPLPFMVFLAFEYLAKTPEAMRERLKGTLFGDTTASALFWARLETDLHGMTYQDYADERCCGICNGASPMQEWQALKCPHCGTDHEEMLRTAKEVEIAIFGPRGIAGLFGEDGRFGG